ncbi:unnamed protein product [Clonostachys rosea]|uniref:Amine oxidase n=1 Tax=Bionectria ochroleuca TaxID=29856 RepID=A0ABY6U8N6_BIOOC|nr:unnamed protein product [Clonostachys rosea]
MKRTRMLKTSILHTCNENRLSPWRRGYPSYNRPQPPHQTPIISQVITAANYEYAFYHTFTLDSTYKLEMKLTAINAHNHQHIYKITAANYEYAFYHTFTLDGIYKLEMKLTGMLNTYCMHPLDTASPLGAGVAPGINAHNHQHAFSLPVHPEIEMKMTGMLKNYYMHPSETASPLSGKVAPAINLHNHQHIFSLRADPEIDGPNNSTLQSDRPYRLEMKLTAMLKTYRMHPSETASPFGAKSDAMLAEAPLGSAENMFNGFYCKKTPLHISETAMSYCAEMSRS